MMFRSIFGDIDVKVPLEKPGRRWWRLRKLTMLSRREVAEKLSVALMTVSRLEHDTEKSGTGMVTVIKLAKLYASLLNSSPIEILEYVYQELKDPGH